MKTYKTLRTLHINGEIWSYVIDRKMGRRCGDIRVYDSNKKMYRISKDYFLDSDRGNNSVYQPSEIKKYVEENLI